MKLFVCAKMKCWRVESEEVETVSTISFVTSREQRKLKPKSNRFALWCYSSFARDQHLCVRQWKKCAAVLFRTQTGRCVTLSYSYFFIFVSLHSQIIPDKSKLASFIKCPSRATSTVQLMQLFSAQNDFSLSLLFHSVSKVQTMVGSYLLLD